MVFEEGKSKIACLSFSKSLLVQALWQQDGDGISGAPLKFMLVLSQPPQLPPLLRPCIFHCSLKSIYNRTMHMILYWVLREARFVPK